MVTYPREVLNRMKWKGGSLKRVWASYVHCGAPGNALTIPAVEIMRFGQSFFATADSKNPHQRSGVVLFNIKEFEKKEIGTT